MNGKECLQVSGFLRYLRSLYCHYRCLQDFPLCFRNSAAYVIKVEIQIILSNKETNPNCIGTLYLLNTVLILIRILFRFLHHNWCSYVTKPQNSGVGLLQTQYTWHQQRWVNTTARNQSCGGSRQHSFLRRCLSLMFSDWNSVCMLCGSWFDYPNNIYKA